MSLTLTNEELYELTHYRRPKEQLKALAEMGIPHKHREHDNTVCVLRVHLATLGPTAGQDAGAAANDGPKLKSSRK